MRIVLILLWLIRSLIARLMIQDCTETLSLNGTISPPDKSNPSVTFLSSVVVPQLFIGQTICYDLWVEDAGNIVKLERLAFVSLVDVTQQYKFKSTYKFTVPTMNVDCECYCHGLHFLCDSVSFDYKSVRKFIFTFHKLKENVPSCPDTRTTTLCCDLSVYDELFLPDHTAVYVADPITTFYLEMGFAAKNGEIIGKMGQTSLSSSVVEAETVIGKVRIEEQFVEQPIPSSRWYFLSDADGFLQTGVLLNDLDERNLSKLGWYKFNADAHLLPIDWNSLKQSIHISVSECSTNSISWQSNASYFYRADSDREYKSTYFSNKHVAVKDGVNKTVQVNPAQKSVTLHVNPDASLQLHSTLNVSDNVIFQNQDVAMDKFRAEIVVNHLRSCTLHLFMHAVSGWFFVSVESVRFPNEVKVVIVISEHPINTFQTLTLSSKPNCPSEVCIYRHDRSFKQCVNASCVESTPLTIRPSNASTPSQEGYVDAATLSVVNVGAILLSTIILLGVFCYVRKNGCCIICSIKIPKHRLENINSPTDTTLIDLSSGPTTPSTTQDTDCDSASYHLYEDLVYETKLTKEKNAFADPKSEHTYLELIDKS